MGGACVVVEDMKTPVPGNRATTCARRPGSDSSMVALRRRYSSTINVRPLLQMSIAAMNPTPIATGTQPPSRILTVFAAKKGTSNERKRRSKATHAAVGQFQVWRITT